MSHQSPDVATLSNSHRVHQARFRANEGTIQEPPLLSLKLVQTLLSIRVGFRQEVGLTPQAHCLTGPCARCNTPTRGYYSFPAISSATSRVLDVPPTS